MAKDPRFKRISPESERETNKVSGKEVYNNTITNNHLIDGSVTNAKLANDSVTADKIAAGAVSTSEINTAAEPTVGTIYSNGWFRSNGATGWYNQTYGGGIWMEDSTYVKVYNGKAFMPSAGSGDNGIIFPLDPGGGGGDSASIKYYAYAGESCFFDISVTNDPLDFVRLVHPSGWLQVGNSRARLQSIGSRGTTGNIVTTPDDSIANALRASGYIEWQSNVGAIGTNYFLSDITKKDNITKSNENAIKIIKSIDYISFNWKPNSGSSGHVKVGVSAQQLQKIEPILVRELSDKTLMVHEPSLIPYLGKAIQEQQEIIETQQKRIDALEERIKLIEDLLK
jgi:hypothetical protein